LIFFNCNNFFDYLIDIGTKEEQKRKKQIINEIKKERNWARNKVL
jgi:hypothetical protein